MSVVFRVDASNQIGTGHLMRCLTLADALGARGRKCLFVCREHEGGLLGVIRDRGHDLAPLPTGGPTQPSQTSARSVYESWLGASWKEDVAQTITAIGGLQFEWLVVDHYGIDYKWEAGIRGHCQKILVIDDLADRNHSCDLLIDQNFCVDMYERYIERISNEAVSLIGPRYALLRPEFRHLRTESLERRLGGKMATLLIFMSGSDPHHEILKVVRGAGLSKTPWKAVDVVVGQGFSAVEELRAAMRGLPSARLHIQTSEMPQLMAAADIAITAGGTVTWEKCALGLPSLVAIMADNQRVISTAMHEIGAHRLIGDAVDLLPGDYARALDSLSCDRLVSMTYKSQAICDGRGVERVLETLEARL